MFAFAWIRWVALVLGTVVVAFSARGADEKPRLLQIPALRDGVLTEVLVHEGQKVEKGAVLAKFDDRLARLDYEIGEEKVKIARMDVKIADDVLERSKKPLALQLEWFGKGRSCGVGIDELRRMELEINRDAAVVEHKKALLRVAEVDHQRAALIVDMHVIRSPRAGTIITIQKRPGEGAKYLETVFQLQP